MKSAFKALEQQSKQGFFNQKKLIKQVLSGQTCYCEQCHQPILCQIEPNNTQFHLYCKNGCTDILLEA